METIEDLTLTKRLGKGSFGEVFLSTKKGRKEFFATKKISKELVHTKNLIKYLNNEIAILKSINHPNIVKLEEVKKSKDYYYIVMEYVNGGELSSCLKKYMKLYNNPFSEEIVQYLMRQIIHALYYIHGKKIIHRDLKLDNIMVHFDNEEDKKCLNMMKAKVKLIDFGFAIQLGKKELTESAVGSPINMDPIILKKFLKRNDPNQLGYDTKADIWSIGTVCYELLMGKPAFEADSLTDLGKKVDAGTYTLPNTVSKEIVSFINSMLLYDANFRLSAEKLLKHQFLVKNVKDFTPVQSMGQSKLNHIQDNESIWMVDNDNQKYQNQMFNDNMGSSIKPIPEMNSQILNKSYTIDMSKKKSNLINTHTSTKSMNLISQHSKQDKEDNNNSTLRRVQTHRPKFKFPTVSFYGQDMRPDLSKEEKQPEISHVSRPQPQMMPYGMQGQNFSPYPNMGGQMNYNYPYTNGNNFNYYM